MANYLILGGSSGLGRSIVYNIAEKANKDDFILIVSSSYYDLSAIKKDLFLRFGVKVEFFVCNLFLDDNYRLSYYLINQLVKFNFIYICAGYSIINDNESISIEDFNKIKILNSNLLYFAKSINDFCSLNPNVCFISSVSTARPRQNNALYTSFKLCIENYLKSNNKIKLKIIKLGFIDTEMTHGKKLLFPVISSRDAANLILNSNSFYTNNYIPFFWVIIFYAIKLVPKFIFNRLKF